MENIISVVNKVFLNYKGLQFEDVSGSIYEIIYKKYIHTHLSYFNIKIVKKGLGKYKIIDGVSEPILKYEHNSYCIKNNNGTYDLHQQYLTNIITRGYIKISFPKNI